MGPRILLQSTLFVIGGFIAIFAVGVRVTGGDVDWRAEGKRWWAHIEFLADDRLEGRDTGSAGHRKAAEYVADHFKRAGLEPAGTEGYLQPIEFNVIEIDEPRSSLALVREGKVEPLTLGEDAILDLSHEAERDVEAEAVFVGYGLVVPEVNYDDLAGLDLRGKIAIRLAGGPASVPGPLRAHYSSSAERWKSLARAGAVGTAVIRNPRTIEIPWSRTALSRFEPEMSLAEPGLQEARGMKFSMTINHERADKFLAGSSHTFQEILAADKAQKPLPRFPLAVKIRARVETRRSKVKSPNVIGLLRGSDPKLRNEYVILTAHLDHVGVGQPINGDKIYNGAMDDASGVASLLEIARMLAADRSSLKRSVVCAAVTGEEKGLLGSKYFAAHPTVPGQNIVADINMDMFLPLFPLNILEVQGLGESTLGDDIREVARATGVEVQADKEPDRNRFIRSDQYSFIRKGIPALAFKFGYPPGAPEDKIFRAWYTNRYHAPSDDARQPVNIEAAAQFNHIIAALARRVANNPERPEWRPQSFFRRFAAGS